MKTTAMPTYRREGNSRIKWRYVILILLLVGCSSVVPVVVTRYQRLAILDFQTPPDTPQIGSKAANLMISSILPTGQYQLVERSQIEQILKEHNLTSVNPKDTAALQKIGTLLKADALIVGTVSTYRVEEYKGKEAVAVVLKDYTVGVKESQSTEVTIGEKGRVVPSKKKKATSVSSERTEVRTSTTREESAQVTARTVLIDQIQIAKRATVSVDCRMVDVTTGRILQAKDKSDTDCYLATNPQEALYLPANDQILNGMMKDIIQQLSWAVSPGAMGMTRGLHKGKKDPIVELGVTYAQRGLWEEAINQWKQALSGNPYNVYALNNLAVAYERAGQYEEAIKSYQEALRLMPREGLFMDNLSRARKDQQERESIK